MSDVLAFLDQVTPPRRALEAAQLDQLFRKITGWNPVLHSGNILGYGSYAYTYESGHSGSTLATGFAPRKAKISIYIMPGYADFAHIWERLGKHTRGKACLYVNKLDDIDLDVLAELIRAGLDDLGKRWAIDPS